MTSTQLLWHRLPRWCVTCQVTFSKMIEIGICRGYSEIFSRIFFTCYVINLYINSRMLVRHPLGIIHGTLMYLGKFPEYRPDAGDHAMSLPCVVSKYRLYHFPPTRVYVIW